jgi:hypothetical protein
MLKQTARYMYLLAALDMTDGWELETIIWANTDGQKLNNDS